MDREFTISVIWDFDKNTIVWIPQKKQVFISNIKIKEYNYIVLTSPLSWLSLVQSQTIIPVFTIAIISCLEQAIIDLGVTRKTILI